MKHVHKLMLTAGAAVGALGGLAWWGTKRAEAKGINKTVLNNPPPQDAVAPAQPVFYSAATTPIVGKSITVQLPNGGTEQAIVVWVESQNPKPRIVVQETSGAKVYVSPK